MYITTDEYKGHSWMKLALVLLSILVYVIYLIFNGLATAQNIAIFPLATGSVSDNYPLSVTPAGWVFGLIWTVIFIWQAVWLLYSVTWLFRRTQDGNYFYRSIEIFDHFVYIAFIINNLIVIGWLFLWSNLQFGWSLLFIVISAIAIHVCLISALRNIYYSKDDMRELGLFVDVVLVRLFLINGLSFYLTWLSIATNLNFATYITYHLSCKEEDASTIALCFILFLVIIYSILENFVWQRFLLYVFTPWIVLLIALIGSFTKNYTFNNPSRNDILIAALLSIICLLAAVKCIMFVLYKTVWFFKADKNRTENYN